MKQYQLLTFPTESELAAAVAGRWLEILRTRVDTHRPYTVAFSGGRIAKRLFSVLAQRLAVDKGALHLVHFFWADERCVPPQDPESNFKAAHDLFLGPLKIPPSFIHRIEGESSAPIAAAKAASELSAVAVRQQHGLPVLDLVLLGMGEDGHTASLFPGEPAKTMDNLAVYRPVIGPKPPPQRITLGYHAIAEASEAWVLISGAGKEQALRESLEPGARTPLGRVLSLRRQTLLCADNSISEVRRVTGKVKVL